MGIKSDVVEQLEASLEAAKEGRKRAEKEVIFFTGQIDRVSSALAAVKSTLTSEDDSGVAVARKTKSSAKASALPRTNSEWWLSLLTTTPKKTADIFAAACAKAGVTSEEDKTALKNRQNSAFKSLVDAKSVSSEGAQQNRTYFLPKA